MRRLTLELGLILALAGAATACSGTTGSPDANQNDATVSDTASNDTASNDTTADDTGSSDATNPTDATTEVCGSATCGASEVCVHPCCGGAAPQCVPPDDAGACPPGTSMGQCFGSGGFQFGCSTQCTPPPPFCAPRPTSGCQGNACAPCPSGAGIESNGSISCLCA